MESEESKDRMILETEFEWMENSRGKPGGPNTTGWAREPPHPW